MVRIVVNDNAGFSSEKVIYVDICDGVSEVLINTSSIITADPETGKRLNLSASAEGGTGEYRYAFYCRRKSKKRWVSLGTEFGTSDTAGFKPLSPGEFEIKIDIIDESGELSSKLLYVSVK